MIKFLDLNKQYFSIKSEIDAAISSVISDSAFIGGKYVEKFEENFSSYQDSKYCIGVGNGTDALEIAIEALDLPGYSEIIVPANSFIASSEAVTRTGHKIVFCNINTDDYTISISDLKKRINKNTSAIIAVHIYGHPCDMDPLLKISKKYNLKVIEDCAQAHGSKYKNIKVGSIGDIGCFSFYPGKNLGAYGDGGAIVTNDERVAVKCRMISNHGRIDKYRHILEGRNSRLDGLQAAILNIKLGYLDRWNEHRINIANYYLDSFVDVPNIVLPIKQIWAKQAYHLFVVRCYDRDALRDGLNNVGIQTGIHYPIALPKLEAYTYAGQSNEDAFAWNIGDQLLSLPIGDHICYDDVDTIVSNVIRILKII
jgi:dTDP-4-amino-4,6-dideoxygalactose transaminase